MVMLTGRGTFIALGFCRGAATWQSVSVLLRARQSPVVRRLLSVTLALTGGSVPLGKTGESKVLLKPVGVWPGVIYITRHENSWVWLGKRARAWNNHMSTGEQKQVKPQGWTGESRQVKEAHKYRLSQYNLWCPLLDGLPLPSYRIPFAWE